MVARLLTRAQHIMVTERFAQQKTLPSNSTRTMVFRRYEPLPRATAPLSEGVPPAGRKLTFTDISVTLSQQGDLVKLTDVIVDTHEDPIVQETTDLLAEQAAETLEELRINVLKAGTNVYYANGAARNQVNTVLTRGLLRKVVRGLKRNKAKFFSQIIKASPKVATEPVGKCFFAMGHTDLESDIRDLPGFVPVEKYSESDAQITGEVGKCENIRFVLTAMFDPWADVGAANADLIATTNAAAAIDVYPLIVVAPDAFATIALKGKEAINVMVVNPGKPSHSNPLGQEGSAGWKTYFGAVILQDLFMARIETGATDDPV